MRVTSPTASYRNGRDMTPEEPSSPSRPLDGGQGLKNALRRVFDSQIPNYGDYNLVFAVQAAAPSARTAYVVGYRWKPAELMIAPVDLTGITGAGVPAEVRGGEVPTPRPWRCRG